jgi:hypothetical protein
MICSISHIFKFKNFEGNLISVPERENFKVFLHETLLKYSIFRSPVGIYKQKHGLNMSSCLSPCMSNIFVNILEQKFVKKYMDSGEIISYSRFADDSCIIINKNSLRSFSKDST